MAKKIHNAGFSILELLVISGVLLTITGFVIVNYNNFNTVERLRQAGKTLKSDIRAVQNKAASSVKPVGCTTLRGYQISFTETSYQYQALCSNGLQGQLTTVALPVDVVFSPLPASFTYLALSGALSQDVTLMLSSSDKTYQLQLSRSGDVNDRGVQ